MNPTHQKWHFRDRELKLRFHCVRRRIKAPTAYVQGKLRIHVHVLRSGVHFSESYSWRRCTHWSADPELLGRPPEPDPPGLGWCRRQPPRRGARVVRKRYPETPREPVTHAELENIPASPSREQRGGKGMPPAPPPCCDRCAHFSPLLSDPPALP